MKPVHNLFNTSLSTKQRLLEKRDNLNCDTDAASLTATLYIDRPDSLQARQADRSATDLFETGESRTSHVKFRDLGGVVVTK